LNPFAGVTVIVVVPLLPAPTVNDAGEAATVKVGGMMYAALATALVE
jgi:hypothetical protein